MDDETRGGAPVGVNIEGILVAKVVVEMVMGLRGNMVEEEKGEGEEEL